MTMRPAKTAEQTEVPFGVDLWGPGNHILDGSLDPQGRGQFSCGLVLSVDNVM